MANTERILFVHAHPDDETITTGGTIATLIDRGSQVTVLTCTRGERGEVIPEDLKPALESREAMTQLRESELASAMAALGVTDHRYLGSQGARWSGSSDRTYVDSGMRWGARGAEASGDVDPVSLTSADFTDVTSDVASVVIAVGPDAVVSYDAHGGYGHPDHIRVHEAARRAADLYGVPFYEILGPDIEAIPSGGITVDITPVLDRKRRALDAYRSQLTLDGDAIVLSGGQRVPLLNVERFALRESQSSEPLAFSDQHPAARFAVTVLAGVIGVAFGGLLSVYNQSTAVIGGNPVWVGAIAAIAITAALLTGIRLAFDSRVVAGFSAVGLVVIVGVFSVLGLGGSEIIPANGPGILWEIAPTIVAVIVLVWPRSRSSRMDRMRVNTVSPRGPQQL